MSRLDLRAMFRNYISQQSLNLESREHFVSFKVRWALVKKKNAFKHEKHLFGSWVPWKAEESKMLWPSLAFKMLCPLIMGITGIPLRWFESYLSGRSFRVAWEGRYPQNINWSLGSSGISSLTLPLLHIHYITGYHHTITWFLLPFLCWWHTALSLISTRRFNGSCTDLRLPGGHLGMDERTPSTAQPGKDWASCIPCHSDSTAWLHHPVRFFYNYSIKFSQKSWCISMTSWLSKSTFQKLLDLAGLLYTTSERSGPFWHSTLHNFLSRPLSF